MKRALRVLVGILALGAVLFGWVILAPRALGGAADYVMTHGSSMEPRLQEGDLVVVRPQAHYRAGSVVAYRAETSTASSCTGSCAPTERASSRKVTTTAGWIRPGRRRRT